MRASAVLQLLCRQRRFHNLERCFSTGISESQLAAMCGDRFSDGMAPLAKVRPTMCGSDGSGPCADVGKNDGEDGVAWWRKTE